MGVVEFAPPLQETKEIIISCLQEIVKSTQKFPRIEKELFPGIFKIKHYCTNSFSKSINFFGGIRWPLLHKVQGSKYKHDTEHMIQTNS